MQYRIKEFLGRTPAAELTEQKAKLAELLNVSVAQLNRLARGDNDPSGRQLKIMATFFGCSVDDLYTEQTAVPEAA